MSRAITGKPFLRHAKWYVRIPITGEHDRPAIHLSTCTADDEPKASERGKLMADLASQMKTAGHVDVLRQVLEMAAASDGDELAEVKKFVDGVARGELVPDLEARTAAANTFRAVAERWTRGELAELYPDNVATKTTADTDVLRLEKHVYPHVEHVPIAEFTLEDAERVMKALPKTLSPASRRHVATLMHRVLGLAVYPLKLRAATPLPRGWLPRIGPRKAMSSLYPTEEAELMAYRLAPLEHRVLYGFLAREGCRRGEAFALLWSSVDLERGVLTLDKNKTDSPRAWALDRGVVRGLARWKKLRGIADGDDGHVFVDVDGKPFDEEDRLASKLRDYLKAAGVTRAELFEKSATRIKLRMHDLRATFATLSLAAGRSESWTCDRGGWTTSAMLNKYRRAARMAEELGLGSLLPLDEAIPELRESPRPIATEANGGDPSDGTNTNEIKGSGHNRKGKAPLDADSERAARRSTSAGSAHELSRASGTATDPVDVALARALEGATAAKEWDRVAEVVGELRARRLERAGDGVVDLERARAKRGGL